MEAFAGVLFHVQTGDADAFDLAGGAVAGGDIEPAVLGDGLVELRDLIALGIVRVEVVLAGEDAALADLAVDGFGGEDGVLDCLAIEDGQGSGQAEAGGADVGVGLAAVLVHAAAEGFGLGEELHVDFKPDDGLVFGQDFWRDRGGDHGSLSYQRQRQERPCAGPAILRTVLDGFAARVKRSLCRRASGRCGRRRRQPRGCG